MVLHQLGLGHRTGVFGRDDDVVLLAVPAAVVELDEDILRLGQSEGLEIQGRGHDPAQCRSRTHFGIARVFVDFRSGPFGKPAVGGERGVHPGVEKVAAAVLTRRCDGRCRRVGGDGEVLVAGIHAGLVGHIVAAPDQFVEGHLVDDVLRRDEAPGLLNHRRLLGGEADGHADVDVAHRARRAAQSHEHFAVALLKLFARDGFAFDAGGAFAVEFHLDIHQLGTQRLFVGNGDVDAGYLLAFEQRTQHIGLLHGEDAVVLMDVDLQVAAGGVDRDLARPLFTRVAVDGDIYILVIVPVADPLCRVRMDPVVFGGEIPAAVGADGERLG